MENSHPLHNEKPIALLKYSKSLPADTIRMEYFKLIKGFVPSPVETFQKVRDTDYVNSLVYFLVLVLINTVLSVPIMLVTLSSMWTVFNGMFQRLGFGTLTGFGIVMFAVMMIIGALVLLFIGAAWLHLRVYLFGGRNGYRETLKALAFGATPAGVDPPGRDAWRDLVSGPFHPGGSRAPGDLNQPGAGPCRPCRDDPAAHRGRAGSVPLHCLYREFSRAGCRVLILPFSFCSGIIERVQPQMGVFY